MSVRVCKTFVWGSFRMAIILAIYAVPATAQTVSLPAADTTLRDGIYADVNFGSGDLETKASTNPSLVRRALLKFDTHTTIPAGSRIDSATLTLTVKSGSVPSRRLAVYCVPSSFDEFQTTWHLRKDSLSWSTPGGDVKHQHGTVVVTNVAGSKVTIDVTAIAREAMLRSSRYTRVLLVDVDRTTTASYMAYYSNEASNPAVRPTLVVKYRVAVPVSTPPSDPPKPPAPANTLRVLHWNIQQGRTTDGKSNLDLIVDWVIKMKPDMISFNEIMHYASASSDHVKIIADRLATRTGETWSYNWVQKGGAASGEGEAVMSRLPLESTATNLLTCTRSVAEVMIMVNGRPINVASTHLDASSKSNTCRMNEISQLKSWYAGFVEQRLLMGDFNASSGSAEITEMTTDYRDAWADALKIDRAIAYPDNSAGNTRRRRIDFVFASKGATFLVLKEAQVYDTRDARGVRPSDHNPLVATFEVR
jgi:endonuclease/exonuclease/phosphatase family metal-dependent hydrolase